MPDCSATGWCWACAYVVGIGAWVFPALLCAVGVMLIQGKHRKTRTNFAGGAALLFLVGISWWHLGHTTRATEFTDITEGGWLGAAVSSGLRALVGDISSHICLFLFSSRRGRLGDRHAPAAFVRPCSRRRAACDDAACPERESLGAGRAAGRRRPERAGGTAAHLHAGGDAEGTHPTSFLGFPSRNRKGRRLQTRGRSTLCSYSPARGLLPPTLQITAPEPPVPISETPRPPAAGGPLRSKEVGSHLPSSPPEKPKAPAGPLVIPEALGDDGTKHEYILPPLELLERSRRRSLSSMSRPSGRKQAVLMQTLNDFKIGANVAQVAMGPTVTRYEVQFEPGILVRKIVALADNLAMSLAAIDVRVEAPIPGKAAIGIEVPNDVTQMVSLRECLSTNEFMNAPSKLTFALGKDVSGEYKYADLTRMPHLLVGGSTNSGKSVCLNVIISSHHLPGDPARSQVRDD